MRLQSVMNAAAYGISTAALAFGLSAPAYAQQTAPSVGCQPKAQVEAVIAKGGYKPIALGDRIDGVGNANIYFANQDGYGFSAEGDRPLGTPVQAQICVTGRYKEVRVNDPRNTELPSWVTIRNGDGKNSSDIKKSYENGMRIVFTARSYGVNNVGVEEAGKVVAIMASPDKLASVLFIDRVGNANAAIGLKNFALTTTANAFVVAQNDSHNGAMLAAAPTGPARP